MDLARAGDDAIADQLCFARKLARELAEGFPGNTEQDAVGDGADGGGAAVSGEKSDFSKAGARAKFEGGVLAALGAARREAHLAGGDDEEAVADVSLRNAYFARGHGHVIRQASQCGKELSGQRAKQVRRG